MDNKYEKENDGFTEKSDLIDINEASVESPEISEQESTEEGTEAPSSSDVGETREKDTYGGKPTTFKGKLENFWYHYKWHTIISAIVVVIVAILISQAGTANKYDINVIYAGSYRFSRFEDFDGSVPYNTAAESLGQMAEDFDGNGEVKVNLIDYYVLTSEEIAEMEDAGLGDDVNYSKIMDDYKSLGQAMMTGEFCVVLFSKAVYDDFYERYNNGTMFQSLTEYIPKSSLSDCEFYGEGNKAIMLSSLRISTLPELENLPSDTVLCLRRPNAPSSFGFGSNTEIFDNSEAVIKNIFKHGVLKKESD